MPNRNMKPDKNQGEIVRQLRNLPGMCVAITSTAGDGFPDILVGYSGTIFKPGAVPGDDHGRYFCGTWPFEIKQPKKRNKLTDSEILWWRAWKGTGGVIVSAEEILIVMGLWHLVPEHTWPDMTDYMEFMKQLPTMRTKEEIALGVIL